MLPSTYIPGIRAWAADQFDPPMKEHMTSQRLGLYIDKGVTDMNLKFIELLKID